MAAQPTSDGRRSPEETAQLEAANEKLRARNTQQSALAALGRTAIGSRDLGALLSEAAGVAAETLGTEFSKVLERVSGADGFVLRAGVGWKDGVVGSTLAAADAADATYMLRSDAPVVTPDLGAELRFDAANGLRDHGVVSAMGVVIHGRSGPWGTLGVHGTRARAFSEDEVGFLQSVANVLALAIERNEVEIAQRTDRDALQALFDNIPVMISHFDESGRLVRANREWERTLGWTVDEAQRLDILAEAYPDPEARREVLAFMKKAERGWADFKPRTRDGRIIDTSWTRFKLSDGSRLGIGLDISERKRAEAERGRLLESESAARAAAEAALERLRAIDTITDSALVHLGVDDLLRELLTRLRRSLEADYTSVLLLDDERKMLYVRAVDGPAHERLPLLRVPLGKSLSGRIAAEGRPLIVDDYSTIDLTGIEGLSPSEMRERAQSVMGAPLRIGDQVVGVVTVTSLRPRRFTEEELKLLLLVADRAAPAIERARLLEKLRTARERQKGLARRLLTAQEEERRRLAVELHDELGQVLTAVKINLGSLERLSGAAPSPSHLREAIASVDHAMQSVRDLALDLRPSVLDDLGLPAALRWYVDRFARDTNVEAHLAIDVVRRLEPELETACFRVAQEALTNVARHARARHVWLSLHLAREGLELSVRDDGTGFDVGAARERAGAGGSIGLLGMQERVSLLRGDFEVRRAPEGGAEIWARFAIGDKGQVTA